MKWLLDQYEIVEKVNSASFYVAEILHHNFCANGDNIVMSAGHIIASTEDADETFNKHTSIQLFLRSDIIFIHENRETEHFYHPSLPDAIVDYLLEEKICTKPVGVNIINYVNSGFTERGQLWADD